MPPARAIRSFSRGGVVHDVCEKAALILEHAHDSARAILKAFDVARSDRAGKRKAGTAGATTDEEQDLLRAMLVMAAAGLDAMAKQLIRDALRFVVHEDDGARQELESFVRRRLDRDFVAMQEGRKARFTPKILASWDLRDQILEEYVQDLTAGSLQSADELRRIAAAFGLTADLIDTDFQALQGIFRVRNQIIHELDVNLAAPRRNRNSRRTTKMVRDTNQVLAASEDLLNAVDRQVGRCEGD